MEFIRLRDNNTDIERMSRMATEILRDYYDPIIGKEQNDYMLALFQSPEGIRDQLSRGYRYYFVIVDGADAGFTAFYPRPDGVMYLSKIYLCKTHRGKGYSRKIINFIVDEAKKEGLSAIELNVNKRNPSVGPYESLGFKRIRSEKNDIGNGFYMDDYVYRLDIV
ncbi:MAG: GNAT family N-acetyltransferase [Abditibacteriota bacterium]|nr:GNAT family N-acetyltransferase [Abditibacteriota bacterium]